MNSPALPMGWALKSPNKKSRFSDKQKQYLKSKFNINIGETTRQKVCQNHDDCKRQQRWPFIHKYIIPYKSTDLWLLFPLAAKRKLQDNVDENDDSDDESREAEKRISQIRDDVISEIVPKHPICYDNHNLCELAERSKLSSFGIVMLRKICDHFDLPTEDIKIKRKAPYVTKLVGLIKMCSCQNDFIYGILELCM